MCPQNKNSGVICTSVKPGSVADKAGIKGNDKIISINGSNIRDVFDYDFYTTEEEVTILLESGEIQITKGQYEDLGIEFETYMIDSETCCTNKCVFCFIDQMPHGMRENLYFKDDDTRLSFLTGSYVTLTNIDDEEIKRVVKYKLSPINVSVHTTNPELRVKMLNNRFAGDILRKIKIMTEGAIDINCQIVLCRGINDGEELERTLSDLLALIPQINSISVVPAGITKYRDNLCKLEAFNKEEAANIIETVKKWQQIFINHVGKRVVYAADELYVKADLEVDTYEEYEEFPQLENGIGMLALLEEEVKEELALRSGNMVSRLKTAFFNLKRKQKITIATGECAYNTIKRLADMVTQQFKYVTVDVIVVKNEFFGGEVTVTGLLTGTDLIGQLKDKELGKRLLLSYDMFKDAKSVLLDDITDDELEAALAVKVVKVYNSGKDFVERILK